MIPFVIYWKLLFLSTLIFIIVILSKTYFFSHGQKKFKTYRTGKFCFESVPCNYDKAHIPMKYQKDDCLNKARKWKYNDPMQMGESSHNTSLDQEHKKLTPDERRWFSLDYPIPVVSPRWIHIQSTFNRTLRLYLCLFIRICIYIYMY